MTEPTIKTTVSNFLAARLAASDKTQRQIAEECGLESPNLITMFKNGSTKLPIIRIGDFAKALGIDPAHLLRVAMTEYQPDTWEAIERIMKGTVLTVNELDLVRKFRIATADQDPRTVSLTLNPGTVFTLVTESA